MKTLYFEIEGLINSFRYHEYKSYHPGYLAPPKTTIIGMLGNLMGYGEDKLYSFLNDNDTKIGVVINKQNGINGLVKDLWAYKTLKPPEKGKRRDKSIVRRDKLFNIKYSIYIVSNDQVLENMHLGLNKLNNLFSLGLDDEMVVIKNAKFVDLEKFQDNRIDSVFPAAYRYRAYISNYGQQVIYPYEVTQAISFNIPFKKSKRIKREAKERIKLVEFYGCKVEFESKEDLYRDSDNDYNIMLY